MSRSMHPVRYRPEVDGLRALSVLSVLFFHAGVPGFGGGFWGVDVFFVVSGYLITRLLLENQRSGTTDLADFYLRRARRILPPLYLVLFCSAVLAWFTLTPSAMLEFSSSLAGATLFFSNLVFWKQSGYFAEINELKPLIHTWSLGIEEQFYLVWPLLLLGALTRLPREKRLPALILLLAASFAVAAALNQLLAGVAFFLPPGRAWELLAGATVAGLEVMRGPTEARRWQAELAAMAGLLMTLLALTVGTWGTGPGTAALPAIVGTCLLLRFAGTGDFASRLLALRPLVLVGLCSYSIYLWHQPVLAFARHFMLDEPDQPTLYSLAALSVALGYLSWRWLERPCRDPSKVSTRTFLVALAIGTAALLGFAVAGYRTEGFESTYLDRLDADQRSVYRSLSAINHPLETGPCRFISTHFDAATETRLLECFDRLGPGFIVLGDSHAQNLFRGVLENSQHPFIVGLADAGCRPQRLLPGCPQAGFQEFASKHPETIRAIIHTQSGFPLLRKASDHGASRTLLAPPSPETWSPNGEALIATEHYLAQLAASRIPVLWLGAWIEPRLSGHTLRKYAMRCDMSQARIMPNVTAVYVALDRALAQWPLAEQGITYVSYINAVRFDERQDLYDCQQVYWRDGDHWSPAGEQRFGARVVAALSGLDVTANLKPQTKREGEASGEQ